MYAVTQYRRSVDFTNRRWRQEQLREPRFLTGNPTPQRLRSGYDSVAFDVLADGTLRRAAASADADRANEPMYHPVGFLQAAVKAGAELTEERSQAGLRHLRMNAAGNKFAMFIDRKTHLPERIEKIIYRPMLGDVVLATEFGDWRSNDGVMLPTRIVQRLDRRWVLSDIRMSKVAVNADVGDIGAPAAVRSSAALAPTVTVTEELIAPGVWYLAGQSHHSVLIEMRDHMLLVEAPQSDARTLAVIQKARALRPGKPLRSVINTHHHFDHSGGVRAAMSEGLSVITHSASKSFFEQLARRKHFIVADNLAKTKRAARVRGAGPKTVLSDGTRTVEIHHVLGSKHAETLLMVYLPAEKLLI